MIRKMGIFKLRYLLFLLLVLLVLSTTDVKAEYIEGGKVEQTLVVGTTAIMKSVCNHVYVSGYESLHYKSMNGTCKIEKYRLQYCKSCGYVAKRVLVNSRSFEKCVH